MEEQFSNLSISDNKEYTFEEYAIKSKILQEDLKVYLPTPECLIHMISRNHRPDQVIVDEKKLKETFSEDKVVDLTKIDKIENDAIIKSLILFLGGMNGHYDVLEVVPESVSHLVTEDKFFENSQSFSGYIEKNLRFIFYEMKVGDIGMFFSVIEMVGIKIEQSKSNILYRIIRDSIMREETNKILIIVAPSNNFWIKSKKEVINETNYHCKLNNIVKLFYKWSFIEKFFDKVVSHPRCYLGFVSSMKSANLETAIKALKCKVDNFPDDFICFEQTAHQNIQQNRKEPKFVRSMEKIKSVLAKKKLFIPEERIIILESEDDKITEDTRFNTVRMNFFSEQYLTYTAEEKEKVDIGEDKLIEYIITLLDNCVDDVRAYLKDNPLN